jgi:hypothetical protein
MTNACPSAMITYVFYSLSLVKTTVCTCMCCQTLHIFGMHIQEFVGIDPWGGESKNLVHQPLRTFVCILSCIVHQLFPFEVLHLPFLHWK